MQTMKRITAVLMLFLVLGFAAPRTFAGDVSTPGLTDTPPGQLEAPPSAHGSQPLGETSTPPGQTDTVPGDTQGPSSASTVGGLAAWLVFQMLTNGWMFR